MPSANSPQELNGQHDAVHMFNNYISRSLQCPRLTVHKNLMVSMILFYSFIIIYLEPYITNRTAGPDYRQLVSIIALICQPKMAKSDIIKARM